MNSKEEVKGIYYAVLAFIIWGLVPVYFKAVDHIEPFEVVSHRVIWSALFLALVLLFSRRLLATFGMLKSSRLMFGLLFSALVISINWLVFIWAVGQERIVESTLGYFINPLINIVFGFFVFSERLRILQWCAVALAAFGVAYQLMVFGELPWIALVLAFSFSTYGVLRKKLRWMRWLGSLLRHCGCHLWQLSTFLYSIMMGDCSFFRKVRIQCSCYWLLGW